MSDLPNDSPPRAAYRLLAALLPTNVAGRSAIGDLIEEYHRRPRGFRRRAWFWAVSLEVVARYLPERLQGLAGGFGRDLVYATRLFRRHKTLVAAAVASLSLAVGVSTAAFSIANGLWLRSNLAADSSIVRIWRRHANGASMAWPASEFSQIRQLATRVTIEGVIPSTEPVEATDSRAVQDTAMVAFVTGRYFSTLQESADAGRLLGEDDDRTGARPVVVLDHWYWRRHFGADRTVLGRSITIHGTPFTVVGIGRRDFIDPTRRRPVMWAPLASFDRLANTVAGQKPQPWAIGRLNGGATTKDANAELTDLLAGVARAPNVPQATAFEAFAATTDEEIHTNTQILIGTFSAIGLVLLLAGANVSNLQLAGAAARRQEIAVRLSCGASRQRILRQIVTEGALLSAAACAIGLLLARWFTPLVAAGMNMGDVDADPDLRVYAFVTMAAILSAVGAALAPAYYSSRTDISTSLTGAISHRGLRIRPSRVRSLLVGLQAAAALVLVTLAALQVRALVHLAWMDPGIDLSHLLSVAADLPRTPAEEARNNAFWPHALERVRAMPGVEGAALASFTPFNVSFGFPFDLHVDGTDADYFRTIGLRIQRGRTYSAAEVAAREKVVVISEALARRFWRDEDPLGMSASRIDTFYNGSQVIGVVADTFIDKVDLRRTPMIYTPLVQDGVTQIAIRTRNPAAMADAVKDVLRELSPEMPIKTTVIEDVFSRQFERPRRFAMLAIGVAVFGLVLSAVGLLGVTAFSTRLRAREIGIRIALGAKHSDVMSLLVRDGMRPVIIGLGVGLLVSLVAARAAASLLYGMSDRDPVALTVSVAILLWAALTAVVLPTRRAAHLDPAVVLRDI